jgi:hypothetical protein
MATQTVNPKMLEALIDLLRFAETHGTMKTLEGVEIALPCIVHARQAIAQAQGAAQ